MRIFKILTTAGILMTTALATTGAQASHRFSEYGDFLNAAERFEYAAKRMRRAIHLHGGHVHVAHKANRLARAARKLRLSAQRGVPLPRLQYKLKAVTYEFRDLRRTYRHNRHLRHDRRIARSFNILLQAHKRLHRAGYWTRDWRRHGNVLNFSMSFAH